jgi:hypothetical protein
MIVVTMPDKGKKFRIKLAPIDPSKVAKGHTAHRGGAGTHHDRRLKRLKTRSAQRQAAFGE